MTLSYKEFMEEARMRLRNYSLEDMRALILNWAEEEHPSKRAEFLFKLMTPKQKQIDEAVPNVETLLDEIEAFGRRVKNGDYCDGWGWDDAIHEERDWGDESWAEEMDEFLLEARSLLLQGEYKLAEEAYRKLFAILEMGQEPGHLPGDLDSANMLNVDLDEQVALFLRSVYQNSPCGGATGIVGNQHRGSYHKAAGLLVAMAETLANRGERQEGMQLIERYRSKYPRHSAFKSEVIKAVQASDI